MDDLRLVREYGADTPLPDAAALASARADLLAGMGKARRRFPLGVRGASTVGIAAAVAAVIAGSTLAFGPQAVSPGSDTPAVETRSDASRVLLAAAVAARTQPEVRPRADQFIYTRTRYADGSVREVWLSVDGTRDGVIKQQGESIPLPGCRDGRAQVIKGTEPLPGQTETCAPTPAYRSDLPTTADEMLAYLDANAGGSRGYVDARGEGMRDLISETYLRPAARAALYEAVARTPGLRTVPDLTDGAGRRGIGITWGAEHTVVVFDAKTYAHIGIDGGSVLQQTVVDAVGATG